MRAERRGNGGGNESRERARKGATRIRALAVSTQLIEVHAWRCALLLRGKNAAGFLPNGGSPADGRSDSKRVKPAEYRYSPSNGVSIRRARGGASLPPLLRSRDPNGARARHLWTRRSRRRRYRSRRGDRSIYRSAIGVGRPRRSAPGILGIPPLVRASRTSRTWPPELHRESAPRCTLAAPSRPSSPLTVSLSRAHAACSRVQRARGRVRADRKEREVEVADDPTCDLPASRDPGGRRFQPCDRVLPLHPDTMDIDAETCVKDWNDLAQDYKELEVRIPAAAGRGQRG